MVVFRIGVGDSNGLALTKREEAVSPVESEDTVVAHVEVDLSATLESRPEDQLATFERVFEVIPALG